MKYLIYPIGFVAIPLMLVVFFPTLWWAILHIKLYMWLLLGMLAYFLLRKIPFYAQNERWLQIESHERMHAVAGMFFMRKIHSLEVYEDHGQVVHSVGRFGDLFISLAPYCYPRITYIMILLRIVGSNASLYVFDFLIGLTLGFYILCYWVEARPFQTDIHKHGYLRSALFILMMWIFNGTLVLLCIREGFVNAILYMAQTYWETLVSWWNFIF
jgi:hypothetical protein